MSMVAGTLFFLDAKHIYCENQGVFVRSHDSAVTASRPAAVSCQHHVSYLQMCSQVLVSLQGRPHESVCVCVLREFQHGAGISGGTVNSPPRDQDEIRVTAFCLFLFPKPSLALCLLSKAATCVSAV